MSMWWWYGWIMAEAPDTYLPSVNYQVTRALAWTIEGRLWNTGYQRSQDDLPLPLTSGPASILEAKVHPPHSFPSSLPPYKSLWDELVCWLYQNPILSSFLISLVPHLSPRCPPVPTLNVPQVGADEGWEGRGGDGRRGGSGNCSWYVCIMKKFSIKIYLMAV